MKNNLLFLLCLLVSQITIGQDGYRTTLVHDGGSEFTIAIVPDFNSATSGNLPKWGQLTFTFKIPNGTTVSNGVSHLPNGAASIGQECVIDLNSPYFPQNGFANSSTHDLVFVNLQGDLYEMSSHHVGGELIPVYTFIIDGSPTTSGIQIPTSGTIELEDNNSEYFSFPGNVFVNTVTMNLEGDFNIPLETYKGKTGAVMYDFTTLSVPDTALSEFKIYPNPVKDIFYFKGDISKIEAVKIYDISGRIVKTLTKNFQKISLANLASANYLVHLKTAEETKVIKIVKE